MKWLQDYLSAKPPPKYPFPIDAKLAAAGKTVFDGNCAGCHASERTGKRMPLAAVGTDAERIDTWNKENAIAANKVVSDFGVERKGLVEAPLDRLQRRRSSTGSGCARRISTTARCRRCAICS